VCLFAFWSVVVVVSGLVGVRISVGVDVWGWVVLGSVVWFWVGVRWCLGWGVVCGVWFLLE